MSLFWKSLFIFIRYQYEAAWPCHSPGCVYNAGNVDIQDATQYLTDEVPTRCHASRTVRIARYSHSRLVEDTETGKASW